MNATVKAIDNVPKEFATEVEFHPWDEHGLPLFIHPRAPRLKTSIDATVQWLRDNADTLDRLVLDAGAVVLRDFPLRDTDDFARMVEHFPSPEFGYSGGAEIGRAHV